MHAKSVVFLASAGLAVAANLHRHGHEHLHKKDLKIETDIEVVTNWVTVTVYDPPAPTVPVVQQVEIVPTSSSSSSSSSSRRTRATRSRKPKTTSSSASSTSVDLPASVPAAEPTTEAVPAPAAPAIPTPETTLITAVKPTEPEPVAPTSVDAPAAPAPTTKVPAAPVETEQAPPPPPAPEAPKPSSVVVPVVEPSTSAVTPTPVVPTAAPAGAPGGKKRGLAYNNKDWLSGFVGSDSKVSWAYGWNQVQDFSNSLGIEFVPMMWGPKPVHIPTWFDNAKKAIANGATALLSFNEPDNKGQCDIKPAEAVDAHIKYMNPFAGQARISTPAITNSGEPGEGISWLTEFLRLCAGKCAVDFAAVHWYSNNGNNFLEHLDAVHAATGLPVWVTEFAPFGNEIPDYNKWLANVTSHLDHDPNYAYVERYSYFMVNEGSLIENGSPSPLGHTFAYVDQPLDSQ